MITLSFIIQYYNHPDNIKDIINNLYQSDEYEILWNNDSKSDLDIFNKYMFNKNGETVLSDNLHEIRGYNKLSKIAKGEYIMFCQDDDIPPLTKEWIDYSINILKKYKDIKLIGFYKGGSDYWGSSYSHKPDINTESNIYDDLIFPYWLNMGPFLISRKDFKRFGKFDETYSDIGECGIGFDSAFSTNIWKNNGLCLLIPNVNIIRGVGGRGTKINKEKFRIRKHRQKKNKKIYYNQFQNSFKDIKRKVNKANLELLPLLPKHL